MTDEMNIPGWPLDYGDETDRLWSSEATRRVLRSLVQRESRAKADVVVMNDQLCDLTFMLKRIKNRFNDFMTLDAVEDKAEKLAAIASELDDFIIYMHRHQIYDSEIFEYRRKNY